ncbi:MAG: hypothetical protein VX924_04515, partial [Candidatus Neomarinimicrobiota bacterium]|nr:hypothetical protein [Candidatus Neomarinimicrobiota bacterium]
RLIKYVESRVGPGNTLYVLTGDHGVMDLPEYLISKKISSGRVPRDLRKETYSKIIDQIDLKIGPKKVVQYGNAFYFNKNLSKEEHNIAVDLIKNLIIKIDGVERALTIQEILELPKSYHNDRLKNMIDPFKSPDIYILLKENWLWKNDYGSSHGSHYDYDSHVPFMVSKYNILKVADNSRVNTVDIPVSVAKYLNVDFPKNLDGLPISLKIIEK